MDCVTKKVCYETVELAEEALINNRVRYHTGPKDIYLCDDCGFYHLTSQGKERSNLSDEKTRQRITRERDAGFWEDKLGR